MANNKLYNEQSIESLSPLEFTRLRPGVYAGDCTYATQLLVEIIANSVDEFRLGHGKKIDVEIQGSEVTVRDYGQGFLVNSMRDDGKTILEAIKEANAKNVFILPNNSNIVMAASQACEVAECENCTVIPSKTISHIHGLFPIQKKYLFLKIYYAILYLASFFQSKNYISSFYNMGTVIYRL